MARVRPDVHYIRPRDIAPGTRVISKHDFDVVYADPPWDINQKGNYGACKHYDLMTLDEIKAMPIADLCKENAVCFLWTTAGALPHAFGVLKEWGFKYSGIYVWIKPGYLGLGQPLRNCVEFCLLGKRGKVEHTCKKQHNWGFFPFQFHSKKPEEMYAVIERLYKNCPDRLELFARERPSNLSYYCWGNECAGGSDIYIPGYPVPEYSDRVKFIPPEKAPTDAPATTSEKSTYQPKHVKEEA